MTTSSTTITDGTSSGSPPTITVTMRQWIAFLTMVFGMFMAILDIQIVASSLNEIGAGLTATRDEISWVQTSYLIAEVVMIPLSGFLSRLLSTRLLFFFSVVGFSISSFLCALSWDINSIIIFRALQGFLGGAMIPTVFASTYLMFPPSKRPLVTVAIGLVATMAPTLGPTLGGYITESFSWHWLFLINVGPGIIVAFLVWHLVHIDEPDYSLLKNIDFVGIFLLALSLGSLQYVLEEGNRHDWFSDTTIVAFSWAAGLGGLAFALWTYLNKHPIVDFTACRSINFCMGSTYSFILGIGLYGCIYLLPVFLAIIRGYNSLQIGFVMFVTGAFQFMSAPIAGMATKFMDLRLMLLFGLLLFAASTHMHSIMTADYSFNELFLPQAIRGVAMMFCFIPINQLALGTLPLHQVKNASGLYNLMRNLGGAIGLSVLSTLITQRTSLHYNRLAENITGNNPTVMNTYNGFLETFTNLGTGQEEVSALKLLSTIVQKQAALMAINDCFYLVSILFYASAIFVPFLNKPTFNVSDSH